MFKYLILISICVNCTTNDENLYLENSETIEFDNINTGNDLDLNSYLSAYNSNIKKFMESETSAVDFERKQKNLSIIYNDVNLTDSSQENPNNYSKQNLNKYFEGLDDPYENISVCENYSTKTPRDQHLNNIKSLASIFSKNVFNNAKCTVNPERLTSECSSIVLERNIEPINVLKGRCTNKKNISDSLSSPIHKYPMIQHNIKLKKKNNKLKIQQRKNLKIQLLNNSDSISFLKLNKKVGELNRSKKKYNTRKLCGRMHITDGEFKDTTAIDVDTIKYYGLLKTFENFLNLIEEYLNTFISKKFIDQHLDVSQLIYISNSKKITGFNTEIFGKWHKHPLETCEIISSNLDFLDCFIKGLEDQQFKKLEEILITCFENPSSVKYNIVVLVKKIEESLLEFLNDEESKYIKSFAPQLCSLSNSYNKLVPCYNIGIMKAFIVFLLMLKRNYVCLRGFMINVKRNDKSFKKIDELFLHETLNTSAFMSIFLKYWQFENCEYVQFNMSNIIEVNCAIKEKMVFLRKSNYINSVLVLEHLIFELKESIEFKQVTKILSCNKDKRGQSFKYRDLYLFCYLILNEINKFRWKILDRFVKGLLLLGVTPKCEEEIKSFCREKKSLNITQYGYVLNILNRYSAYKDLSIIKLIRSKLYCLNRKKIKVANI